MKKKVILTFNDFKLKAELFDTKIAERFYRNLPYSIDLTVWGSELYGSINHDLGSDNPVPDIPSGGLAYTNQGNYFCLFFGQTPAWAVEHIGQVVNTEWKKLFQIRPSRVFIARDSN